jgi:osmoprotectant transport system substrate-binding protein
MKPSWRRLLGLLLVMSALILAVAACGGDDDDENTGSTVPTTPETDGTSGSKSERIVLGTKDFTEEFILGELYKQALEAKGYKVTLKSNIGATEIIDQALKSGKINMYPEYTGTALTVVFGKAGSASTADATYDQAKELYEARGQTLLEMTPFSDSDAIAVLKTTADRYGLQALGDLKKVPDLSLCGQPQFRTRIQGLPGLRKNYGVTQVKFVPVGTLSPYQFLDEKKVLACAIFSTDPPLASGKYVVLDDPKAQFGFQNIAPVVDQDLVDSLGTEFEDAVNAVSEKLTSDAIIAMNKAVAIDQQQPQAVARKFLQANDLL